MGEECGGNVCWYITKLVAVQQDCTTHVVQDTLCGLYSKFYGMLKYIADYNGVLKLMESFIHVHERNIVN